MTEANQPKHPDRPALITDSDRSHPVPQESLDEGSDEEAAKAEAELELEQTMERQQAQFAEWLRSDIRPSEAEAFEHRIAWWNETLRAEDLVKQSTLTPLQAAMALCRFNPFDPVARAEWLHSDIHDVLPWAEEENHEVFRSTPEDHESMLSWCESVGSSHSLKEWLNLAREKGRRVHPWVAEYVSQPSQTASEGRPEPDPTSQPIKRPRKDALTPVILRAVQEADDPGDANEVMQVLRRWATSDDRPPPPLGVDDDDGAIKWEGYAKDGAPKFLKQGALKKRLTRLQQPRAAAKRR